MTWLDRRALAERLLISRDDIARLVKRGRLPVPSYHLGPRSPRWDAEAIDTMMAGRQTAASTDAIVQEAARALAQGRQNRTPQARGRHGARVPLPARAAG